MIQITDFPPFISISGKEITSLSSSSRALRRIEKNCTSTVEIFSCSYSINICIHIALNVGVETL